MLRPTSRRLSRVACALVAATLLPSAANAQRVLGLDVSAWQGNWSTTTWATLKRSTTQQVGGVFGDGRDFVFIRSSRGGTTGYYDQSDSDNSNGLNTLSQRYDDPYFVQNITRATNAGLFAGSYHFSRPDIIATTTNSNGIANTGADEADHFIQMAGAWMRPGYLMPVHDLEAGDGVRTDAQMAQFAIDFSDRVYSVMGIRPAIYINGNYANAVVGSSNVTAAKRLELVNAYPILWTARWPNQANPDAIDVQNTNPNTGASTVYGPWDDYGDSQPWTFWQYASTGRLNAYNGNLDLDVAHGGMEFLKDQLVPALLWNTTNADWSTLATWNSGQTPTAPVQGPGQVARVGTLVLPTARLPASNDTVILDRGTSNPTITLGSGAHNIRKLYIRESLNFTGGTLAVNYVPTSDSTPNSVQISAAFTMSGTASLSAHTIQVDANQTFALTGGSLAFSSLVLMPHASTPAKLAPGSITLSSINGTTANVSNGVASGLTGYIDLGAGEKRINVLDGAAVVDVAINVPLRNGAIIKGGAGTLRFNGANNYTGRTTVEAGTLEISHANGAQTPLIGGSTPGGANLTGGKLVFDYTGFPSPSTTILSQLDASYNTGFTTGVFISSPPISSSYGIGWIDNTATKRLTVARTRYGDANLDFTVDFADLLAMAQNYDAAGNWAQGDFNYDNTVNFDDLLALSQNYGSSAFAADWALAQSLVPEPTTLLAMAGSITLLRRRRA